MKPSIVIFSLAFCGIAGIVFAERIGRPSLKTSAEWILKWSPDSKLKTEGLGAFEGVEDDRVKSHPGVNDRSFGNSLSN